VLPGLTFAAIAVAFSFSVDAIAVPRSSLHRPLVAISLHVAAVAVVASASFSLTGRPLFSISLIVVLMALLAVVSNAKYKALREPVVFTDLSLFSQAFAHPRLYLPFLGVAKILAIVAGASVAMTGFLLESPMGMPQRCAASLLAIGCVPLCLVLSHRLPVTVDPTSDQRRFGFFATFLAYLIKGLKRSEQRAFSRAVDTGPFSSGHPDLHPDVIIVQSESYFDARQLGEFVLPDPYANLDRIRREAFEQGRLAVHAWGANTMRSEFAMLTGLPSTALGYARFYPYLYVRHACASIAGWFKRGGYRTLAIHPYHADFFGRRRAFRLMHFDHFLDIRDFNGTARVGPYVGDAAVADAIIARLQRRDEKPVFAFAITMENHGPLKLEPVAPGEFKRRHTLGDDARWRDLTAYLRHIENADRMLGKLIDYLRQRERPAVLCFYGDHVPALTSIFDALATSPADSDYFIWRNFGRNFGDQRDVPVENLGSAIQRAIMREDCISGYSQNDMQQAPA
jgi:phosphoglycerol transferase MdoB-like AlkP superfamily enzyme